jgi:uncharacterized protein (TIGR03546 family)
MFWLKYLQGLFRTLNENTSPNEIATGVALGAILGLIPKTNLLALGLWIVVLIFQVNISMATASVLLFAILGHITDPLIEKLGYWLLTGIPALKGTWAFLYNTPIIPFTSFNNTLVTGNLFFGILLFLPAFFGMRWFVVAYRVKYKERIMKWRIMQALQASKIYDLYSRWTHR